MKTTKKILLGYTLFEVLMVLVVVAALITGIMVLYQRVRESLQGKELADGIIRIVNEAKSWNQENLAAHIYTGYESVSSKELCKSEDSLKDLCSENGDLIVSSLGSQIKVAPNKDNKFHFDLSINPCGSEGKSDPIVNNALKQISLLAVTYDKKKCLMEFEG